MNPIELTDKQSGRFLEMCRELFPEYAFEFAGNFSDWNIIHINKIGEDKIFENIHHWFEFCYTYLIEKLNLKIYNYTRYKLEEGDIHIVDYLYEQFKQLKINKW